MSKKPKTPIDHLLHLIDRIPRAEMWKGGLRCVACGAFVTTDTLGESHSEGCWRVDLYHAAEKVRRERKAQKKAAKE